MMRRGWPWLLTLAWACQPQAGDDRDTDTDDTDRVVDTDVPDTDTDVDSDTQVVDTDPVDLGDGITLETSGVVTCADPSLRALERFSKVRAAEQPMPEALFRLVGGGVVLADLTGNGEIEVFSPGWVTHQLHVLQPDGSYVDEAVDRLPAGVSLDYASGASIVDLEGDGDLDLFVTRWDLPNVVLVNDGTGHFTDGTARSGITGIGRSQASAWGDMDGDGDLDLFVGNYGPHPFDAFAAEEDFTAGDASQIWINDGHGRFSDHSAILPQRVADAYTFMGAWQDMDGDLRPELLVINDFGWARPSTLFWNRPEGLVQDDGTLGIDAPFAGMGLAIGDVNGDLVPDLVQTSWKAASLLTSSPFGTYFESAQALGYTPVWEWPGTTGVEPPPGWTNPRQIFGWGTELADLDNDGDEDLLVNFGFWDEWQREDVQRDALYERQANGLFEDRAEDWGMNDRGASRGMAVADLNHDGYPDVVKRVLGDRTPMYVSNCGDAAWLSIALSAPAPNTFGVGARILVRDGDRTWVRWLHAGGTSIYSAGPIEAHVGLGDRDTVEHLEIDWPDGTVTVVDDVPTRQHLRFVRE
ncbi:MAG: CRTAC1 family protein [Alphaproteobacteria bacterium]|nr:CRTAC1 family protein [Alphaproteobacteria bacterium]